MEAILSAPHPRIGRRGNLLLRLADVIIAVTALAVLAPVMLCFAVAVMVESGFPIFYRQRRLGQGGRTFMILKFRKFRNDSDPAGPHLTCRDDGRMTRVGALMQKTKIDELPQFLNVLRGDMAIVGPRPESLRFIDCFGGRYGEVLTYKPGILGPNQVLFRNEDSLFEGRSDVESYYRQVLFPLKATIDLVYFSQHTFTSDLRLIISAAGAICGLTSRTEHLILNREGDRTRRAAPRQASLVARAILRRLVHRHRPQADLDRSGAAP